MALKYHAGDRVTGLSTDAKPMFVATNSVFYETDTNKTQDFNGSAWTERPDSITVSEITASGTPSADTVLKGNASWGTVEGTEFNTFTSTSTWNPNKQTGTAQITIDASDLSNGTVNINVDGSSVSAYESGVSTKIYTASSSISVQTTDKGHDIASASYDSINKTFDTYFQGMYFKSDGLKWYIAGYDGLKEYDLSTAWALNTASVNDTFALRPTIEFTTTVYFNPDGTQAFVAGQVSSDPIREITLSTAWDVSTASYSGDTFTPVSGSNVRGLWFKSDGTKLYALTSN